jgi:hypothetical protein
MHPLTKKEHYITIHDDQCLHQNWKIAQLIFFFSLFRLILISRSAFLDDQCQQSYCVRATLINYYPINRIFKGLYENCRVIRGHTTPLQNECIDGGSVSTNEQRDCNCESHFHHRDSHPTSDKEYELTST